MKKPTNQPGVPRPAPAALGDDELAKVAGGGNADIIKTCEAPDLIRPDELTESASRTVQLTGTTTRLR